MSFPKREEGIAVELCEGLQKLNNKLGKHNFDLHIRFANEAKGRWDEDFLLKEVETYSTNLEKIWVCGPPKMNEEFDKVLGKLSLKMGLKKDQVEIM